MAVAYASWVNRSQCDILQGLKLMHLSFFQVFLLFWGGVHFLKIDSSFVLKQWKPKQRLHITLKAPKSRFFVLKVMKIL